MEYRCVATSPEGFVAQLVNYITHGFTFYVTGEVPAGKDPAKVDHSIIENYGLEASRHEKSRRKRAGQAGVHYLRLENFFVILATHGKGRFFEREKGVRDVREDPIKFRGYSIALRFDNAQKREGKRKLRGSVRIHADEYVRLKAHALELAKHRSVGEVGSFLWNIPFEPYAPVRQQLLNILRAVNRAREAARFPEVPLRSVRMKRRLVSAFSLSAKEGEVEDAA